MTEDITIVLATMIIIVIAVWYFMKLINQSSEQLSKKRAELEEKYADEMVDDVIKTEAIKSQTYYMRMVLLILVIIIFMVGHVFLFPFIEVLIENCELIFCLHAVFATYIVGAIMVMFVSFIFMIIMLVNNYKKENNTLYRLNIEKLQIVLRCMKQSSIQNLSYLVM